MIYLVLLVAPLSFLLMVGVAWWQGRADVDRLADPEPLPGEVAWCGRCGHCHGAEGCPPRDLAGPFPVDTGPMLLLGEKAAALVAHEREVRAMIVAAEREIGPVQ
jgi:mono/diheme cytochrome c family protein